MSEEIPPGPGGEADLIVPALDNSDPTRMVSFLGLSGHDLLLAGLVVCLLGIGFGVVIFWHLRRLPVHDSMRAVSELIYETCKTYLQTQLRFVLLLEAFIAVVIIAYFGWLEGMAPLRVGVILGFSLLGILGSASVAWFGIRVNTFANSRTAFASLRGRPYDVFAIPLAAGMSIGMLLISVELLLMLGILLFIPGDYAGPCFLGFAIGESLGASALRIAGGIFTKIADIGADLMKIVFKIKEDDARNPGVIADCTGDNAGDSVGPSADGFETYGVTGVALVSFILLAVHDPRAQVLLLVWIFAMRIVMVLTSAVSYFASQGIARAKWFGARALDFEHPLTLLVWLTSLLSIAATFATSWLLVPALGGDPSQWWKLSVIISCGTLAGAIIPEIIKVFTSTHSAHVREVVTASREGGASLNVLSGITAGNYSAFWMGLTLVALMGIAYGISRLGLGQAMTVGVLDASPVFAFGLVAFGFLGMGPVTIAVDSYGPVTDNAQSVYELSEIEALPGAEEEIRRDFGFTPDFDRAKTYLEQNDGAGNTFKATAKPVLIGTAVVGATTMIFSIVVVLTDGLHSLDKIARLSLLHPPFLLGLICGGAVIYWFSGATIQAVTTGAYRAVEFIKANIRLDRGDRASLADSKRVVEICTLYAQKGMLNIFLTTFFGTLAFAFLEPFLFIGFLIGMALFGLFQALFMANAGGAWDNAKKVVEVDLREKGSALHDASVVGDTVGDPFKDTASVAMNPVIKFTTLFGLLAVGLAESIRLPDGALTSPDRINHSLPAMIAAACLLTALVFAWRSFYGMRIKTLRLRSGGPPSSRGAPRSAPRIAPDSGRLQERPGIG